MEYEDITYIFLDRIYRIDIIIYLLPFQTKGRRLHPPLRRNKTIGSTPNLPDQTKLPRSGLLFFSFIRKLKKQKSNKSCKSCLIHNGIRGHYT